MNPILYVVVAVAVAIALYFLFGKKTKPEIGSGEESESPALPKAKATAKALATSESSPANAEEKLPKKSEAAKKPVSAAAEPAKRPSTKPDAAKSAPTGTDSSGDTQEPRASVGEPVAAEAEKVVLESAATPEKKSSKRSEAKKDVAGLRLGLSKARNDEGLFGRLKSLFGGKKEIDPEIAQRLEEVLITSDVGVKTTASLVEEIQGELSRGELSDEDKVWTSLRSKAERILDLGGGPLQFQTQPTVVLVVGVNGVGKTTTIGKLATRYAHEGKKIVLAAGDTFRAAAVQQLVVWGKRAGCEVVTGPEGANSGSVIFDAIQKAKETGADLVLADTAGRLHTKTNLMDELKKATKNLSKAMEGAPHEVLLVLDATNGQNAVQQAAQFKEAIPLTGIVLTKLDGTAKGGVILGICAEHKVPVRYIGLGERPEDLREFDAPEFVEALLGTSDA